MSRRPPAQRQPVRRFGLGGAALLALVAAPPAAAFECQAALVLALDLSPSVDAIEERLQFNGVASALSDPEVRDALLSPPGSGVAAAAFVWSGGAEQEIIAPWSQLSDDASILDFADRIARARARMSRSATALGSALRFAALMHQANPIDCARRIIDIAGDGAVNDGEAPEQVRRDGLLGDVEINGLVIGGGTPDPLSYYQRFVIQGPGAFALGVATYDSYRDGMRRKLLRELRHVFAETAR